MITPIEDPIIAPTRADDSLDSLVMDSEVTGGRGGDVAGNVVGFNGNVVIDTRVSVGVVVGSGGGANSATGATGASTTGDGSGTETAGGSI